jgi:hypothetical protein
LQSLRSLALPSCRLTTEQLTALFRDYISFLVAEGFTYIENAFPLPGEEGIVIKRCQLGEKYIKIMINGGNCRELQREKRKDKEKIKS